MLFLNKRSQITKNNLEKYVKSFEKRIIKGLKPYEMYTIFYDLKITKNKIKIWMHKPYILPEGEGFKIPIETSFIIILISGWVNEYFDAYYAIFSPFKIRIKYRKPIKLFKWYI